MLDVTHIWSGSTYRGCPLSEEDKRGDRWRPDCQRGEVNEMKPGVDENMLVNLKPLVPADRAGVAFAVHAGC